MPTSEGDHELQDALALAAQGDEQAWRRLVSYYGPRVFGLILHQCRDRDLAEEVMQATFVKVVAAIDTYDDQGRFEPWLFRIAMNHLRDEMRRRKRQATPLSVTEDPEGSGNAWFETRSGTGRGTDGRADDPFEQASRREQHERLRSAVGAMSEADRQILTLRHTAGLSFAQIARTLDQPLGTVLARAHRAVGKLRKLLETDELDD
jgi:RNA polymerase sigma-70 factor (ECF subfamily)